MQVNKITDQKLDPRENIYGEPLSRIAGKKNKFKCTKFHFGDSTTLKSHYLTLAHTS